MRNTPNDNQFPETSTSSGNYPYWSFAPEIATPLECKGGAAVEISPPHVDANVQRQIVMNEVSKQLYQVIKEV